MAIAEGIYLLCAATSLVAAALLLRYYFTRRSRLLVWSCMGFLGLAVNNILVFVDLAVFRDLDLSVPRTLAGTLGMLALAYGLASEPDA